MINKITKHLCFIFTLIFILLPFSLIFSSSDNIISTDYPITTFDDFDNDCHITK